MTARITLIGGPTALVEFGGFRFLTDPTFDEPGDYQLPHVTLTKTSRPTIAAADVGPVDAVLLSHDQHADNLDNSGRDFLRKAPLALTTAGVSHRRERSPDARGREGEPVDPHPDRVENGVRDRRY